jgi:tRNA G18 (ribose-2'-O)-methylase SpoU
MPRFDVTALDDPRLAPYRNLKDRELAAAGDRFLAESRHCALRLVASDFPCESVLVAAKRWDVMRQHLPDQVPAFVVPDALVQDIVGFKFHSGVLAIGRRTPSLTLAQRVASLEADAPGKPLTFMVLPHTRNAENLGALIRIAAGFGVDALLLGPQCADPFWRRTIRVSMGTVFHLPMILSPDLPRDLNDLRDRFGFTRIAAVTDADAVSLHLTARPAPPARDRLALLLGSEDQGLTHEQAAACDRKVTIPMHLGTDSLNVAVAAAVFLYHFTPARHEARHDLG